MLDMPLACAVRTYSCPNTSNTEARIYRMNTNAPGTPTVSAGSIACVLNGPDHPATGTKSSQTANTSIKNGAVKNTGNA